MTQRPSTRQMRSYWTVWFGQFTSFIGLEMVAFATGVWIYLETGSALLFAISFILTAVSFAVTPRLARPLITRMSPRQGMLVGECGAGATLLIIWALFLTNSVAIWHIYLLRIAIAVCRAIQEECLAQATTDFVAEADRGRVTTTGTIGQTIGMIGSQPLSAILIITTQFQSVFVVAAVTYVFSAVILLMTRFPATTKIPAPSNHQPDEASFAIGWHYLSSRLGLLGLVFFSSFARVCLGLVSVLLMPLVLSFSSIFVMSLIAAAVGVGSVMGFLLADLWKTSQHRTLSILGLVLLQGVLLIVVGLQPSILTIAIATPLFLMALLMGSRHNQSILESKVELQMQESVQKTKNTIGFAGLLGGYVIAGTFAEFVFRPSLGISIW